MELILFPSYLNPCTCQDIFHCGAIELGQVLIKLSIREESFTESVNHGLLIAEWDGDLFFVELSHIVVEGLCTSLLDAIKVTR